MSLKNIKTKKKNDGYVNKRKNMPSKNQFKGPVKRNDRRIERTEGNKNKQVKEPAKFSAKNFIKKLFN